MLLLNPLQNSATSLISYSLQSPYIRKSKNRQREFTSLSAVTSALENEITTGIVIEAATTATTAATTATATLVRTARLSASSIRRKTADLRSIRKKNKTKRRLDLRQLTQADLIQIPADSIVDLDNMLPNTREET